MHPMHATRCKRIERWLVLYDAEDWFREFKELTPLRTSHIGLLRWTKDQAVDMPFGLCHDVHTPTDRRDAPLRGRTS